MMQMESATAVHADMVCKGVIAMVESIESLKILSRIADALERLAPPHTPPIDLNSADAFLWNSHRNELQIVDNVQYIPLNLLIGIDRQKDVLLSNTRQFAQGYSANNVLLWGARGMGKSSLIKAVHAAVNEEVSNRLALIEIHREDIESLPTLLEHLRKAERRCLVLCDDLSFEKGESSYKSLKAVLEGGIEGRPDNVLFYATSNRRHLMPRDMMENERSTAISPAEAVEEAVSLSDRFGIWLGLYASSQDEYLQMVQSYAAHFDLSVSDADALEWAQTRGARSGRVAWQFIQDAAGKSHLTMKQ